MRDKDVFGIYDKKSTLPLFFGTNDECGRYFGITTDQFSRGFSKLNMGKKKSFHGCLIEKICKESELNKNDEEILENRRIQ